MTPAWKRSVVEALAKNARDGKAPRNMAELEEELGLSKAGLGRTFKIDVPWEEQQQASVYVDDICRILAIPTPRELDREAEEIVKGVTTTGSMTTFRFVASIQRELKHMPPEVKERVARLIAEFLGDAELG